MSVDPDQLSILIYPHPALRQKGEPVDPADEHVHAVARRMIQLMHEADGVGLAAPQVGLAWRLFVTHGRDYDPEDRVFINPRLDIGRGEMITEEEGCLSLPGIHVQVRRADHVDITAHGLDGEPFSMSADAFLTRIWQHENDHLDGVLIIDKMTPMDRLATRKALKELKTASVATGGDAL
ncbi:MAG: peptide deformylase [Planctomycetota bacterium]|nr:peptide deformylase [Planctomycetota bacterium]